MVIAANRDEFFQRPTEAAHVWPEYPSIIAGRDIEYGGSWLGISHNDRFAAITNLREAPGGDRSRGELVRDFLLAKTRCSDFFAQLEEQKAHYRPFNMVAFDGDRLAITHSLSSGWQELPPGLHCIGNLPFGQRNRKIDKAMADFRDTLHAAHTDTLLGMMQDDQPCEPSDDTLQRALSSRFVRSEHYGTRSSSIVVRHQGAKWDFWEQAYQTGQPCGERRHFELQANTAAKP